MLTFPLTRTSSTPPWSGSVESATYRKDGETFVASKATYSLVRLAQRLTGNLCLSRRHPLNHMINQKVIALLPNADELRVSAIDRAAGGGCAHTVRPRSTSAVRHQIVKEQEGRQLGRRAAWNNVVFCIQFREMKSGVKENCRQRANYWTASIPETGTLASGMPGGRVTPSGLNSDCTLRASLNFLLQLHLNISLVPMTLKTGA